jgi:hypothetical protein
MPSVGKQSGNQFDVGFWAAISARIPCRDGRSRRSRERAAENAADQVLMRRREGSMQFARRDVLHLGAAAIAMLPPGPLSRDSGGTVKVQFCIELERWQTERQSSWIAEHS